MVAAVSLLGSNPGRAAPADVYETERTRKVLSDLGFTEDAEAAGKRIGKIHIVRHDVFAEDEPWPTFLNALHVQTEEDVVARELLFAEGERWDQARVDESMRNLRNQVIFSFVRIVAVHPRAPSAPPAIPAEGSPPAAPVPDDTVDVLVYVRDLWSLRLESSFAFTDGLINQLTLTLIERNLLGRNVQGAASFELLPATWSLGGLFVDRRIMGSRWQVAGGLDFVMSRENDELEGTRGSLSLALPLWDLRPRWGFELSAAWDETVGRQLSGSELLTWDDPATTETEAIPRIWEQDIVKVVLAGYRQFGEEVTHRLAFGYAGYVSDWEPHAQTGLARDSEQAEAFREDVLPRSREQLYPFIRWHAFTPTWHVFHELAAFGLSEDIRLGPWVNLFFGAPLHAFGSERNALTWEASAGLVLAPHWGDDHALIDLFAGLDGRLELGEVIDQGYRVRLRGASPRFLLGRLALLVDLESRVSDSSRSLVTLGGDNGLRGYPSQAFYGFGEDRLRASLELRTPPIVLGSVHIGGVLFYDAGGIGEGPADLDLHHAVGLGLRMLLPQFNRFAFRFDLGFPLDADHVTVLLTIGSTQALPLTSLEDDKLSQ